ncbi:uncharacterized protein LOC111381512 [Olea europaea var. sylvestris]|uniref:uncharacterized protein LOC111381512 n=1 Tax=Olea europaea var. sylvestris TaxID=158386 RepID=UPI000C1D2349|nr:uncharacterized protein LOC111381512 [Olea europaea var. sylvestris]
MGNCRSCEPRSTVTAKLILVDGELEEFPCPIKVSNLLEQNPDCFICNSDEMGFGEFVSAIDGDEELQPGELYFELPLKWLSHRLQVEDMASLAVKASVALTRSDGITKCCGSKKVGPMILFHEKDDKARPLLAADGGGRAYSCKGRKFDSKLSIVLEE